MNCSKCGLPLNTAGECTNWRCMPPTPITYPPTGCICPPTSEQTCKSPTCPRQDHTHPDLEQPLKKPWV